VWFWVWGAVGGVGVVGGPSLATALAFAGEAILGVRFDGSGPGGGQGRPGRPGASPAYCPPLPLPLPVAVAILDSASARASFTASLLERYVRLVAASQASSRLDAPARGTDDMTLATHALQGRYVLLERAYLLNAAALALRGGPGAGPWRYAPNATGWAWTPVGVHEDTRVRTYAWCDALFYIASKSLARAVGTGCDMAAAGVTNFVAGCLEEGVTAVVARCVVLAGQGWPEEGRMVPSLAEEEEDVEGEVAAALTAALGGPAARSAPASPRPSAPAEPARPEGEHPPVCDEAVWALNTVATVGLYAASLYERTAAELASVFPATEEGEDGGHGEVEHGDRKSKAPQAARAIAPWEPPAFSFIPRVHSYLSGPLETLHAAAVSFAFGGGPASAALPHLHAAARSLVTTVCGPGLAALTLCLSGKPYVLSEGQFEGGGEEEEEGGTGGAVHIFAAAVLAPLRLPALAAVTLPVIVDAVVQALARATAAAFEGGWGVGGGGGTPPALVNEYGALLMAAQLRAVLDALEGLAARGAHRRPFGRLVQVLAVLGLDAPHELYGLTFPRPLLSQAEVEGLLIKRGWGRGVKVNWDRVQLK